MTRLSTTAACAALLALVASSGARAHGDQPEASPRKYEPSKVEATAFGREGDPKKVSRTVRVDMADTMRFTPAEVSLRRGQTLRFAVHNDGKLLHEMVLGTAAALKEHAALMQRFPQMEHADPNIAHVKPGTTGEIVWQFTRAGKFQFACLQPGHYEAGMVGRVIVR